MLRFAKREVKSFAAITLWATFFGLAPTTRAQALPEPPQTAASATPQIIVIPENTPVQLRFAQPVRGMVPGRWGRVSVEAKAGDKVRLVVVNVVRENGLVVINKGAIGQATVNRVWLPSKTHDRYGNDTSRPQTGLSLQLDWIESVTGQQIPLRVSPSGEPRPFTVEVLSKDGGLVARPDSMRRDLIQVATFMNLLTMFHLRTWIPVGTRLQAFTLGTTAINAAEAKQAQALLVASNVNGILTVYRKKGQRDTHTHLFCDSKEVGTLGELQYTILDLTPGAHSCHVADGRPSDLTVIAGEEYFIHLRHGAFSGWELKLVNMSEGEDAIAGMELVRSN